MAQLPGLQPGFVPRPYYRAMRQQNFHLFAVHAFRSEHEAPALRGFGIKPRQSSCPDSTGRLCQVQSFHKLVKSLSRQTKLFRRPGNVAFELINRLRYGLFFERLPRFQQARSRLHRLRSLQTEIPMSEL